MTERTSENFPDSDALADFGTSFLDDFRKDPKAELNRLTAAEPSVLVTTAVALEYIRLTPVKDSLDDQEHIKDIFTHEGSLARVLRDICVGLAVAKMDDVTRPEARVSKGRLLPYFRDLKNLVWNLGGGPLIF